MTATAATPGRAPALDGIRAIAILAVIAFHAGLPGLGGGGSGVIVFFVLSGFLITNILIRQDLTSDGRLVRFYIKRFLRLFPALAVVTAAITLAACLTMHGQARHLALTEALAAITYTQDLVLGAHGTISDYGYLGHTWSLGVEEQFYLIWPLLLILAAKMRLSPLAMVVASAGLTLLAALWRMHLSYLGLNERVGVDIDGNAESLLVGCTLALGLRTYPGFFVRNRRLIGIIALAGAPVVLVSFTGVMDRLPLDNGRLLCALGSAIIIAEVSTFPLAALGRGIGHRVLAYIGLLSYSLYLWHPIVFDFSKNQFGLSTMRDKVIYGVPAAVVVFLLAWLSYRFIETPFLRIKDRLGTKSEAVTEAIEPQARGYDRESPTVPVPAAGSREAPRTLPGQRESAGASATQRRVQ
jgi:peptidoglycan/LPS O-acetylase OafA/YrhL